MSRMQQLLLTMLVIFSTIFMLTSCENATKPKTNNNTNYSIEIGQEQFLPTQGVPKELIKQLEQTISARASLANQDITSAHLLIQFFTPLTPELQSTLKQQSISILNKVNAVTWIASTDIEGAKTIRKNKQIRWAGIYPTAAKLSADINLQDPFKWQLRPNGKVAFSVLFHQDITANEVLQLEKNFAGLKLENFDPKAFAIIKTTTIVIPDNKLNTLQNIDIIRWIEPGEEPYVPTNQANTQPLSNVDDVQVAPYNLSGTGITVGVWEANETGTNAIVRNTHQDLTPRAFLAADQVLPAPPVYSDHATHVAGTIAASGVNSAAAEGMAPAASIVSWNSNNDAAEMTNAATSDGSPGNPIPIVISNHSYGQDLGWDADGAGFDATGFTRFGQYRNNSSSYDTVVNSTDLIAVFAAGNERNDQWDGTTIIPGAPAILRDCLQGGFGVDADCISPTGTAKNIITVGAMNGAGAIAGFSSFGPTDDGRIKPDVMAQGVGVFSLGNASNTDTTTKGGTSMATPAVAGIAALLLEEASNIGITLSAAAVKALLIQTAQDVTGVGQATVGPDYATGWGIADVQAAADILRLPAGPGVVQESLANTGVANGYTHSFYFPPGQAEMHVTLAWSDLAGDPTTPSGVQLVNDLDLRLIAPDDTIFTPWTLNPAAPGNAATRNGGDDTTNNVEQVSVLNPAEGVWTVRVTAKAGSLATGAQNFALAGPLTPTAGPIDSIKADVMLVLDRSGSMSLPSATAGLTKLEALQSAATEFVDFMELVGGHQIGLIQFDTNVAPFAPAFDLQSLDAASAPNAQAAIASMTTGAWTNIIDGVTEAENQLSGPSASNPTKAILLFSDGKHNRPVGSDVADIDDIMDDNTEFYAIGYGTDVDSTVMPTVAANHNGLYLEEQTLDAGQLSKLFLTMAGLTVNEDVVIDPNYNIPSDGAVEQKVYLHPEDNVITFATHWSHNDSDAISFRITGPNKRCKIPPRDHGRFATRTGSRYHLVRIELPYLCQGVNTVMHEGSWSLIVRNHGLEAEQANIMALTNSSLKFNTHVTVKDQLVFLEAQFAQKKPTKKAKHKIFAVINPPIAATLDSEKQDAAGTKLNDDGSTTTTPDRIEHSDGIQFPLPTLRDNDIFQLHPNQILKFPKTKYRLFDKTVAGPVQQISSPPNHIFFKDDGKSGDKESGDGIYTAVIKLEQKGFYQARIVGQISTGRGVHSREGMESFIVK